MSQMQVRCVSLSGRMFYLITITVCLLIGGGSGGSISIKTYSLYYRNSYVSVLGGNPLTYGNGSAGGGGRVSFVVRFFLNKSSCSFLISNFSRSNLFFVPL